MAISIPKARSQQYHAITPANAGVLLFTNSMLAKRMAGVVLIPYVFGLLDVGCKIDFETVLV